MNESSLSGLNHQEELSLDLFNQFLLASLEATNQYIQSFANKRQQAINFFIAIFTALTSASVVILTTVQDDSLKLTLLALVLFALGVYSLLTYYWLLTLWGYLRHEAYTRSVLYRYFASLNPISFEKSGLLDMSSEYSRMFTNRLGTQEPVVFLVYLLLQLFGSLLLAVATYLIWYSYLGFANMTLSAIVGFIALSISIALRINISQTVRKDHELAQNIISKHYS